MNGARATIGSKVTPGVDDVRLDGIIVADAAPAARWRMLHKPLRVLTTRADDRGRRTVMDLMPPGEGALFPVGRLDYMTTGLLLLTTDGEVAHRLLHPARHVEKVYRVTVADPLTADQLGRLRDGSIRLDGRRVKPAAARPRGPGRYEVRVTEGRNRQVRRMFEALGHPVRALHRVAFGPLRLGDLPRGQSRELTAAERRALEEMTEAP